MYCKYAAIAIIPRPKLQKNYDKKMTIDKFSENDCYHQLRFKKEDLKNIFLNLAFPNIITLDNNIILPGEEIFLRGLYELVTGESKHSVAKIFGRDFSVQSRSFTYFIDHLYSKCEQLMNNNLEWFLRNKFFEESAEAISSKLNLDCQLFIAAFIDCNCMPTSRVGGGPAESGANAARWSAAVQQAFYNGNHSLFFSAIYFRCIGYTLSFFFPAIYIGCSLFFPRYLYRLISFFSPLFI